MKSFIGPQDSRRATWIPDCRRRISNCPPGETRRLEPTLSTFEEERREALASVLHSLATEAPDPDRTAACCDLLWHLAHLAARH
jgi:hypothetical protein